MVNAAFAGALGAGLAMPPYLLQIICLAGINIILAVSLNLINGFTGQFSIGHAGFMAIGAYASAFFTVTFGDRVRAASSASCRRSARTASCSWSGSRSARCSRRWPGSWWACPLCVCAGTTSPS